MATVSKMSNSLRQLTSDKVRVLWHIDFWDGPINGLCVYEGKKHWFEMYTDAGQDDSETSNRRFLLVQLSPDQLAEEERWHELFREKVGTHSDHDEPNPQVKPPVSHREFYEAWRKRAKPDYSSNPVLGWFELT